MKLKISLKTPSNENLYGLLASLQHVGIEVYKIGLPGSRRRWALLRSPHVNSKSRLHYEFLLSRYRLEIKIPSKDLYKIFRILQSFRNYFSTNTIVKVQITR
jgi:ribosomal protein S10